MTTRSERAERRVAADFDGEVFDAVLLDAEDFDGALLDAEDFAAVLVAELFATLCVAGAPRDGCGRFFCCAEEACGSRRAQMMMMTRRTSVTHHKTA